MAHRSISSAVTFALMAAGGCGSLERDDPFAKTLRPQPQLARGDKPTTVDPVSDVFRNDQAAHAEQNGELLRPLTPPSQPDDSGTIAALARKSESHARAMENAMKSRDAEIPSKKIETVVRTAKQTESSARPPKAVPVAAAPPKMSSVQWLDPSNYQLALGDGPEPRNAEEPITKPSAEQVALTDIPVERPMPKAAPVEPARNAVTDASNVPLELADAGDQPAVAMMTKSAPDNSISLPTLTTDSALSAKFSKRIRENPRDIAAHLDYQMLLFLQDEQVPNLAAIAPLPQEDRELVTAVLDGVSNLRSTLRRDANLMLAEKIKPIVELAERLKTSAELTVPVMTLARKVEGFGRYESMDARIIAGKETPAIVYCEIENFSSQLNSNQEWESNLSMEVVLFSEMGQQVFQDLPATISDTSRSRRRDFFIRKLIKLPANLVIGRYVLKVTLVDTQSNRVAETSLPVQVVAQ